MENVIFFVLGLLIGSFLNVVITRLKTFETILGRSFCRKCKTQIRWYDNIPLLSFIILRGRCRDCNEKISWQYPIIELATASLFALVGIFFFQASDPVSWIETVMILGVVSVSMVIFIYDLKYMEIPMIVLWMGVFWVVLLSVWIDWAIFSEARDIFALHLHEGIIAGFGAFLFFFLMATLSRETWMGLGDAYVALLMGLVLGWPAILFALVIAFSVGAIVGIIAIITASKTLKSKLPFAPFLLFGMLVFIFLEKVYPQWQSLFYLL